MFNLTEQAEKICEIMQSDSSEIKLKIINKLLDQLQGYYAQCAQKYTSDPSDCADYEKAYHEAKCYFDFIEANCKEWLSTSEAESTKSTYDNYIGYARLYLFTTYKPPHPSIQSDVPTSST